MAKNKISRVVVDVGNPNDLQRLARTLLGAISITQNTRERMRRLAMKVDAQVMQPMLEKLRHYPPERDPSLPVEWSSDKQRRYVMMLMKRRKIKLPYERTGAYGRSWQVSYRVVGRKISFKVENTWEGSQYVGGKIGLSEARAKQRNYLKPQQPYHRVTGWPPAYIAVQEGYKKARIVAENAIEELSEDIFSLGGKVSKD